ncbi:MAG: Antitoxin MazE [Syntrophaceae bacterium PtaB.Bin038]|jgi:antitoxin MazE|nr:MAG: Antitoxin MazE [Syntrophaceae bacterium PtaB.Bin038]
MKARMQKWGNSLAIRIPKAFATEVGLKEESEVDVSLKSGKLVVAPVEKPGATLKRLLAKITEENVHGEVDAGPATGRESW